MLMHYVLATNKKIQYDNQVYTYHQIFKAIHQNTHTNKGIDMNTQITPQQHWTQNNDPVVLKIPSIIPHFQSSHAQTHPGTPRSVQRC